MEIKPIDILQQEFKHAFRGYEPQEVDAFLELVAKDYGEAIKQLERLQNEMSRKAGSAVKYEKMKDTFEGALVSAQKIADEVKEKGRKEAETLVKEAALKAEKTLREADLILSEARVKARSAVRDIMDEEKRLRGEIEKLIAWKKDFEQSIRRLIDDQLAILEKSAGESEKSVGVLSFPKPRWDDDEEDLEGKGAEADAIAEEASADSLIDDDGGDDDDLKEEEGA